MQIYLLTHQRELDRKTNTGSLAVDTADKMVERIVWDRVNPNIKLLEIIKSEKTALLYLNGNISQSIDEEIDNIIILDSTWQEAKKMYNQSDYLQTLQKITLSHSKTSQYQLRKNQPSGGLCTIECVIELFNLKGKFKTAKKLQNEFVKFNN